MTMQHRKSLLSCQTPFSKGGSERKRIPMKMAAFQKIAYLTGYYQPKICFSSTSFNPPCKMNSDFFLLCQLPFVAEHSKSKKESNSNVDSLAC